MKNSSRLFIALTLTLVLAVAAVGVWASPAARQGTVPIFPEEFTGSAGEEINFGTGTVVGEGTGTLTVTTSSDPGETGPLPNGWSGLFDYVSVVTTGEISGVKICAPLSPDWKDKKVGETLNWFVWADGKWTEVETSIEKGPPEMLCGAGEGAGVYTVLGK